MGGAAGSAEWHRNLARKQQHVTQGGLHDAGTNSGLFRMEESLAEKEASGVPDEVGATFVAIPLRHSILA